MKVEIEKGYKVKVPSFGREGDAGYDFYVPEKTDVFISEYLRMNESNITAYYNLKSNNIVIAPYGAVTIPTGIKVDFNQRGVKGMLFKFLGLKLCLVAENRSGLAKARGLTVMSRVVDSNYTGVVFVTIHNTTKKEQILTHGQKFVQYVKYFYSKTEIKVSESVEEKPREVKRL